MIVSIKVSLKCRVLITDRPDICSYNDINTARWDPEAVHRNCRRGVPVDALVDRSHHFAFLSVMHKNKYVKDKKMKDR